MPFVTKIVTDERVGTRNLGKEISNPTLAQTVEAVHRLDGKQFTEVILIGNGRDLTIGGGNDGRYIAFVSVNTDEAFFNLINDCNLPGEVNVVTGGQMGSFAKRQVSNVASVVSAAKEFYNSGLVLADLKWEEQR